MDYASYHVVGRDDAATLQFKEVVFQLASISWVICFEADRWLYVESVVLAQSRADGRNVGMATIAPCNEAGEGGPEIIGVWVHPYVRKRGVGLGLVRAGSAYVQEHYSTLPVLEAYSQQGHALVVAAERESLCIPRYIVGAETFRLP